MNRLIYLEDLDVDLDEVFGGLFLFSIISKTMSHIDKNYSEEAQIRMAKMTKKSSKSSGQLGKMVTARNNQNSGGPSGITKSGQKQEVSREFWAFRFTSSKVPKFQDLTQILVSEDWVAEWIFQLEKGGMNGVEHYQGWLQTKPKKRRSQLRDFFTEKFPELKFPNEDYLEASKSKASAEYAGKKDTRVDGPWYSHAMKPKISMEIEEDDIMKYDELPPWSQRVIDMVTNKPLPDKEDRQIHWFWSQEGRNYKTETCRYLVHHHEAYVLSGASRHVLAATYANPRPIYIFCIPRSAENGISYKSIELIKDSLYMSGFGTKATGMVNRKKPWVFIFCNFEPNREEMSADRWVVEDVEVNKRKPDNSFFDGCDLSAFS